MRCFLILAGLLACVAPINAGDDIPWIFEKRLTDLEKRVAVIEQRLDEQQPKINRTATTSVSIAPVTTYQPVTVCGPNGCAVTYRPVTTTVAVARDNEGVNQPVVYYTTQARFSNGTFGAFGTGAGLSCGAGGCGVSVGLTRPILPRFRGW